jgi:hypothetical protein
MAHARVEKRAKFSHRSHVTRLREIDLPAGQIHLRRKCCG